MPEQRFEHDVFISYSSRNQAWVRGELLTRIEAAGLKAFIDFRDFARGAPGIREMERAVKTCMKTLVVLTPEFIESGWTEAESIMTQVLDPANRELRLIPVLKAECDRPLWLSALTHIDFTDGADLDLAWKQLLTALGRPPEPEPPKTPRRDEWLLAHPYPMPPNFTGRAAEREMLTKWLNEDAAHPLLVLRALGGFGKSALTWHWLINDVSPAAWPRVVWWSFYEGDASFDNFVERGLEYLGKGQLDPAKRQGKNAVITLLQMLREAGTLLVLDGFERLLRAFGGLDAAYGGDDETHRDFQEGNDRDCISPLVEDFLRRLAVLPDVNSKVLLTTRVCPHVLEAKGGGHLRGCREEELNRMQAADAVGFMRAQGIRGTRTEIQAACEPYGFHPLSLRILAGWILGDFEQPGDITAAWRIDVSGDLVQRQQHVLEVGYNSLTPRRQRLLGRIACFRGAARYEVVKHLADARSTQEALDADLRDLLARGVLHYDGKESRFDLHPIVRRYAYDHLPRAERIKTHRHLRDYFASMPQPGKVTRLGELAPVIELYHHTVRAGLFDDAWQVLRHRLVPDPLHFEFSAYQLMVELKQALFPDGEDKPPRLKNDGEKAWTLNALATSYTGEGQPARAVPLFSEAISLSTGSENIAICLTSLAAGALAPIGELKAAEGGLRRVISLCEASKDERQGPVAHMELGLLLAYRAEWASSEAELQRASSVFDSLGPERTNYGSVACAYRAVHALLALRCDVHRKSDAADSALHWANRALDLANETARKVHAFERDFVRAHWLLGRAVHAFGQRDIAKQHLDEALERCRRINMVEYEAEILIALTRFHIMDGALDDAQRLADEAMVITERSGYVLQGADANLEIAELALARSDETTARHHATEAHRLATCDGPPDYTYKVAYDEAAALLADL